MRFICRVSLVLILGLLFLMIYMAGCAKKTPTPLCTDPKQCSIPIITTEEATQVEIFMADGSDQPPEWMIQQIVKTTEQFCQDAQKGHVAKIIIVYDAETNSAAVSYRCERDK